jgi:hypothetical protein
MLGQPRCLREVTLPLEEINRWSGRRVATFPHWNPPFFVFCRPFSSVLMNLPGVASSMSYPVGYYTPVVPYSIVLCRIAFHLDVNFVFCFLLLLVYFWFLVYS